MMRFFLILFLITMTASSYPTLSQKPFTPPKTRQTPVTDTLHGNYLTDNYRWLEDKDSAEVKAWSHAQHNYTVDYLKTNTPEIAGLRDEIKNYLDRDVIGAPFFKGNREFFYAKKKGDQQHKFYTKIDGKEIKIFDPIDYDKNGKASISGVDFTLDGNKAAVGIQYKGNEINEYRIIDTKTGKVLGEPITGLNGFNWTRDEKHAYLSIRTKEMIDKQIPVSTYLHSIGDDRKNDKFLIAPKDAKDVSSIWDPEEGTLTFFSEGDFYSNTLSVRKIGTMDEPKVIYSSKKFRANAVVKKDRIFFHTNDNAPNFKIMVAEIDKPEFENWKVFIPEKETVIEGFEITTDYFIVQDKKDVLRRLTAYDLNGKLIKEIDLPELGDVSGMSYHKETNTLFVSLNTFTAASKIYKLDGKTLKWEFFYQDKPPIDTKNIESKLIFFKSKDGTRVPMFLAYKKGLKLDGTNPTLLYGYGGFNVSMTPNYLGTTASFINRGGVYALVCLRGGNEYGEKWHDDGMLLKKQNSFDDFISAAEYLIKEKYTNPNKLGIKGGSNGGLLMGAVVTQRPELFKASVCAVPLLDMIRYHKFLIARFWIPEYGNADVKADYDNIIKYSPYQNIKPGVNYPTMLVKAGENDSRVDPLHAKKFAAALQNNPGQKNPIMLYIDFESGHGSGQSIAQMVENIELEWRFFMNALGMK